MTPSIDFPAARAVAALCACLLAAPAALAQPMPPPDGPDGAHGAPPFLRGLDLSEEQQDRVFAILHGQAPQRREFDKAARKAGAALRDLERAPQLDEAQAAASAQALGQAIAGQELLRLQAGARIKAVLNPEQRAQLEASRGDRRAGRGERKGARAQRREAGQ